MHIVILAWLFVTFTMALTMKSFAAGVALFVVVGLGPVGLYAAIAMHRHRARKQSMLEREANRRDDADTEPDQ